MADQVDKTPAPDTTANEDSAAKTVPLAELLKERKARQEFEAKLKELESRDQTELQKAQARLRELEPYKEKAEKALERAKARLDAALKKVPKEAREKLEGTLGKLDPDDALDLLESLDLVKPPSQTPPVDRGTPNRNKAPDGAPKTFAEWKAMPAEERHKWRNYAASLPD